MSTADVADYVEEDNAELGFYSTSTNLCVKEKSVAARGKENENCSQKTASEPLCKKRKVMSEEAREEEEEEEEEEKDETLRRYLLLCGPESKLPEGYTRWELFCATIKDKTVEEQSAMQTDLLSYCHLWKTRDDGVLYKRLILHPSEEVRWQIFREISRISYYEYKNDLMFKTLADGAEYLREHDIEIEDVE